MNDNSSRSIRQVFIGASLSAAIFIGAIGSGCSSSQEMINHSPAQRAEGMRQYQDGNYADAAGSFRQAIRSDPRDYKSQFYLAQSYENLKQYQQAIQAYKASLDAQPRTLAGKEDNQQRLATIKALAACIAKSDTNNAETNLIEAAAKNSKQAQDWLLLANIHRNRGDADSALDAYNRAALSDPKDFDVVKEYALYLEQVGQQQQAAKQLKKAYSLNQNDDQVNNALRRLNVIPGPGLKDERALVKPPIPQGPLPEVEWSKFRIGGSKPTAEATAATPAAAPTGGQAVQPAPAQPLEPPAMPTAAPQTSAPRD
jgi:tetratricopeptide (TPR) repeat protein